MNYENNNNFSYIKQSINIVKEQLLEIEIENEVKFYENLKLNFTLTKSYLQFAASFSHLKNHKKALFCGKKCLFYMNELLKNIEILFCVEKRENEINFKFKNFWKFEKKLKNEKKLLKTFFSFFEDARRINKFCIDFLDFVINSKKVINSEKFKKFENFKINFISKKLKPKWIKKLSIINFMHIEYIYLKRLNLKISFFEIFSEGFLSILISLCCVIYFMISTENRFFLLLNNKKNKNSNFKIKSIFEKNHYEKLKKMKNFVFSELLHSKSILILQNYFFENSLLSHFTNSFLKNYQENLILENIEEVSEVNSTINLNNTNFEYSFDLSENKKNFGISKNFEKSQFSKFEKNQNFGNNKGGVYENFENSASFEDFENFDVIKKNVVLKIKKIEKEKKKVKIDNKKIKSKFICNLNQILGKSKKNLEEKITIKKYKKKKF